MTVKLIPGRGMYANAYIGGETILVDAGVTPMAIEAYRDTIRYIVLTHGHFDHIAYLPAIVKMTGAQVCIHAADAECLKNDAFSLAMHFGAHAPGLIPDRILKDGDTIDGFEVLHTPGHTAGSISLYDPVTRDLISGDTVFSDGAFGRYDFPGGSKDTLAVSLDRLAGLEVTGLYPGHGIPVQEQGARHIRAAQALIRSRFG